jgi:hypothetical protein
VVCGSGDALLGRERSKGQKTAQTVFELISLASVIAFL